MEALTIAEPGKRMNKLRELRKLHDRILKNREAYFGKPLERPSHRPNPFCDLSLEEICNLRYSDGAALRFAQNGQERTKFINQLRKKWPPPREEAVEV